jgi:ABC-type Fe3+ transport system, periplasmic component
MKPAISRIAIAIVIIVIIVAAIGGVYYYYYQMQQASQRVVVIYADYSANVAQPYFNNFTADTGIKVVPLYASMGELVGKLVAEKSSPVADVLFGGAPSAYIGADEQGVLASYIPLAVKNDQTYLNAKSLYSSDWTWYSFTYNILGIIINTQQMSKYNLPMPKSWWDLLNPVYKGHIIIENPSTSTTTGLGFFSLIWQIYISKYGMQNGTAAFENYVKNFMSNVVSPITPDDMHAETVLGQSTDGAAITIDWINAAPLYKELDGYPLQAILVNDNILGPTAMGIVNGAPHMKAAEAYVNWVFSYQGQKLIPTVFLKPAIIYNNITPPGNFPPLSTEEQMAFPYNQTFTTQYASQIDSIFNQYSSLVQTSSLILVFSSSTVKYGNINMPVFSVSSLNLNAMLIPTQKEPLFFVYLNWLFSPTTEGTILSTLPGSFAGHLMSTLISLITPSTAILASASLEKHE